MIQYNVYYGTIGSNDYAKCQYRVTKKFKNEAEAKKYLNTMMESFYYKNEGKYGIPKYTQVIEEHQITECPLEILYLEHIKDMMRGYLIPTELDTISYDNLL